MDRFQFLEAVFDHMPDGVYVLDDEGNYLFVNSAYIRHLHMPKSVLLNYNVHDFVTTGQIDFCISDVVYREKRQVTMFQDVLDTQNYGRNRLRQMVTSTPIFDSKGNVSNIVAMVRPLNQLNDFYYQASRNDVSTFSGTRPEATVTGQDIIAVSESMRRVFATAATVASVDSAVLLTGESGTGKEVVAQFIHDSSARQKKDMVIINCASLPENLLEAELFGYEKGAFTGALTAGKIGYFEIADGGTLFLDEINSLPLNLQGKVLRAIETKTIQRIGSTQIRKVDFRLITATNEDLFQLVAEKRFRQDLYYRLNVIPIQLPPLRKRKEDIVPLAVHFINYYSTKYDKVRSFSQQAFNSMLEYPWSGNVRELKNFVERLVVMSVGETIEIQHVEAFLGDSPRQSQHSENSIVMQNYLPAVDAQLEQFLDAGVSLDDYINQCEREYLNCVLKKYPNSYKAAEVLGTSQTSIIRKKKKHDL